MLRLAIGFWLMVGPALAQVTIDMSTLPLADGPELSPQTHVILSLPLSDDALRVATADALAAEYGLEVAAIWPLAAIGVSCYVLSVPAGVDVDEVTEELRADPRISTVGPVETYGALTAYDDDLVSLQHGLQRINALAVHDVFTGTGVRVAVIDSGVEADHPDLVHQSITNRDFVTRNAPNTAHERHGTAMTALIVADAKNNAGMVGIAPDADILALRACWQVSDGADQCNSFTLARALNFSLLNKADIINLSIGGPHDPLLERLIEQALTENVIVVAAYGSGEDGMFPAKQPGVIAARAAHLGSVDDAVLAPGLEVISARPHRSYDFFTGDSVAAAHVSGVAALLLSSSAADADAVVKAMYAVGSGGDDDRHLDACAALQTLQKDTLEICP